MVTWFTADTHFGHTNIIEYCNRPFSSIEEMDEILIENWNKVVNKKDLIYHLGDFCFVNNAHFYARRLNGNINIIPGNHDKRWIKRFDLRHSNKITVFQPLVELKYNDKYLVLCHYAMRVWNRSHYNSYHLYGHSHDSLDSWGKSMDVGVDATNYYPISIDTVMDIMETKPDNFNYLGDTNV